MHDGRCQVGQHKSNDGIVFTRYVLNTTLASPFPATDVSVDAKCVGCFVPCIQKLDANVLIHKHRVTKLEVSSFLYSVYHCLERQVGRALHVHHDIFFVPAI